MEKKINKCIYKNIQFFFIKFKIQIKCNIFKYLIAYGLSFINNIVLIWHKQHISSISKNKGNKYV